MKIETIKERIKNAESKLEKSNGTLERHNLQLEKKKALLVGQGINLADYNKYDRDTITHEMYWDICDYESKLEDIKSTEKKIKETTETLQKLNDQLKDQVAKEKATDDLIPEVLNIFLENWKQKCIVYYTDLANEFITLSTKTYEITKAELELLRKEKYDRERRETILIRKYNDEEITKIMNGEYSYYEDDIRSNIRFRYIQSFRSCHFKSDINVIENIITHDEISTPMLNKILDDDVKVKKEMFISRIKEVIGTIKDLGGLTIGRNGEINGIAKGVKCNAKVETITAGGYNIQCYHYRVLVNTIK